MSGVEGKAVLVTGGTQGIGLGVARALLDGGARVAIVGRDPAKQELAVRDLEKLGTVSGIVADVAVVGDCERMVQEATDALGELDVLVNVAGVFVPGPFLDVSEADFDYQFDINVKGTFFATQAFTRPLVAAGRPGKVINISSTAGQRGFGGVSVYCSTKAAVDHLTRVMAAELAPVGVNVNCVVPGNIDMPTNKLMVEPGAREATAARTPARRNGFPEDIGAAVLYLASDAADFVHGAGLVVDGGILAGH
jgi:NAD(P)-dependent dehydrogenase (short-subunit alcohol dehydrogenase family)